MPQPTLARIAGAITTHPEVFRTAVTGEFGRLKPQALLLVGQAAAHEELPAACAWVLKNSPSGTLSDYATTVVRQLAFEHRRSSTDPALYDAFATALTAGVRAVCRAALMPPTSPAETTATQILTHTCRIMRDAAQQADADNIPAFVGGVVADVERRCSRVTVIRIQTDAPVSYPAGGAVAYGHELNLAVWRTLFPAVPANDFGQLEFHVPNQATGVDALLLSPQVGDRVRIAAPYQPIAVTTDHDLLLISHGVGLAPLRAIISSVMMHANPPRIHLFVGAEYPGELYDLLTLWHQAATAPRLAVTPVAEHPEDAWWVRATEHSRPPRGLHLMQVGQAGEVAASYGTWEDRSIIIAGPLADVQASTAALVAGGTPPEKIQQLVLDERLPLQGT